MGQFVLLHNALFTQCKWKNEIWNKQNKTDKETNNNMPLDQTSDYGQSDYTCMPYRIWFYEMSGNMPDETLMTMATLCSIKLILFAYKRISIHSFFQKNFTYGDYFCMDFRVCHP